MKRMLAARVLFALLTLVIISIVVFAATQALPGDAALVQLGKQATPAALESLRARMHLDQPLVAQYWLWLTDLVHGHLGNSLATNMSVGALIGDRVANTLVLLVVTGVIALPLATAIGILTAIRRDRAADHTASVVMLVIVAIPEFVFCLLFVALFATNVLHVLPAVSLIDPDQPLLSQASAFVLPVLTLVIVSLPYIARTVRACMLEALESDYVAMARLKGVPERQVIVKHALPAIAGPVFQVSAQTLAYLAGGIVVVETVFQFPGIGFAFVQGIQSRDLPVVQALALMLAAVYVILNSVADLGTVAMTPTLRKGAR
ncbi:ABC transporter permease [Amycolatopsis sp. NPDC003676]